MRAIDKIIIHCSATPEERDIDASTIKEWHVNERKWSDIGYHWVIKLDGTIEKGRHESKTGAHVKGHNSRSIGICYVGGLDADMNPKDTRTNLQKEALRCLLIDLLKRYPQAGILGHNNLSKKACPSFDAKTEYANLTDTED